jgi:hypothetical protein
MTCRMCWGSKDGKKDVRGNLIQKILNMQFFLAKQDFLSWEMGITTEVRIIIADFLLFDD